MAEWTPQRLARMYLGLKELSALLRGEFLIERTEFPEDFRVIAVEPKGPNKVLLTFSSRTLPELRVGEAPPLVDPYRFDFTLRKPSRWGSSIVVPRAIRM